eukprot:1009758-Rhodomonas_salina.1
MLPAPCPTVITTLRVPPTPWLARHTTPVFDPHIVASHPVNPRLPLPLYPATPNPAPCTVALNEPVTARFEIMNVLPPMPAPISNDKASDRVPDAPSAVTTVRKLLSTPDPD